MSGWQATRELKRDTFGRIELLEGNGGERALRRVARGTGVPGSDLIARLLLARERRALRAADGLEGVPRLLDSPQALAAPSLDGRVPPPGRCLLRSWIEGAPLSEAERLPGDFFDWLDALVGELHARGVCHNDLHKEQNVLVRRDGRPALIDFQLASVHRGRGLVFRRRCEDDLRHLQKHRRRYTRDGRGPSEAAHGRGYGIRRRGLARAWRRLGKPPYLWVTRRLLRTRDGEPRRPSTGPWPTWDPPLGPPSAAPPPGSTRRLR